MRRVSSPTFVGRAEELAALDAALARAAEGEPAVVLVAGESGVGKSRLVAEFGERASASGARVLTGDCVDLGEGELPYAPLVRMLRSLDPDELTELAGPGRAELVPLLGDAGEARPDDQFAQARMFDLLLLLFERLGERAPLVLVIEDIHWADRSTRDFLAFLVRALRRERLVLAATYRSDELHRKHPMRSLLAELERLGRAQRVEVRRFSRLELVAQLTGILEETPDVELTEALYTRSEGNPFFAEELLAAGGRDGFLPETLRDALMVRIEALPEPSQELLRLAAVAGRSVTHRLLARVAEDEEADLLQWLREAVVHHVLVQGRSDDSYAFRHALMREAIYEDLLPGERGSLHVKIARALADDHSLSLDATGPAAELAFHWYAAHDLPRALEASVEAGTQAERMRAPAEASHHFENAIEIWERVEAPEELTGTTLVDLVRRAAERSYLAGDPERAAALARRALDAPETAADPVTAALLRERLGRYLWSSGRDGEALEEYQEAVRLIPADPPSPERARALASLSQVLMLLGDMSRSRELALEAIELARDTGARDVEAHAMTTLGTDHAALGLRAQGIAEMREALAMAHQLGDADDLQRCYTNLSDALDQAGEVKEAADLALEGVEAVRGLGLGRGYSGFLLAEAAGRRMRLGLLDDAEELTAQALDEAPSGVSAGFIHDMRGRLEMHRGRCDEAERQVAMARREMASAVGAQWLAPVYASLCELAGWRADEAEVRRLMAGVRESMIESEAMNYYIVPLYLAAVRAEADAAERARDRGDPEAEALAKSSGRELAAHTDRFREGRELEGEPPPQVLADIATLTAELSRLEGQARPDAWIEPIARNDALGNVLAAAAGRMRRAEALLDGTGDREAATEPLRVAHAATLESGAHALRAEIEALARRARIELANSDAPAGDASEAERLGLTPRETEVLALVAAGRTNRQIGEELFISEKTASVHVSRILAKLSVRGRGEAAAVAHRLGLAGEQPVLGA